MTQEVKRNYLEIKSIHDLKEVNQPSKDYSLNLLAMKKKENLILMSWVHNFVPLGLD